MQRILFFVLCAACLAATACADGLGGPFTKEGAVDDRHDPLAPKALSANALESLDRINAKMKTLRKEHGGNVENTLVLLRITTNANGKITDVASPNLPSQDSELPTPLEAVGGMPVRGPDGKMVIVAGVPQKATEAALKIAAMLLVGESLFAEEGVAVMTLEIPVPKEVL